MPQRKSYRGEEYVPVAANVTDNNGLSPLHSISRRSKPSAAVAIVQFLLDCDPNVKLQKIGETMSLLCYACLQQYNDSNIEAALESSC